MHILKGCCRLRCSVVLAGPSVRGARESSSLRAQPWEGRPPGPPGPTQADPTTTTRHGLKTMGLLVDGGKYGWPLITLLGNLLQSLNPNLPFDSSQPERDEYTSRWYLHPQQHAAEMVVALVLFGPLLYVCYTKMTAQMQDLRIRYQPSRAQVLWSYGLLMTLVLQSPLKLDPKRFVSHPAYFLQPCHVSSVLYFLSSVIPSQMSFITFHSLSLLTWGPSLAFAVPNLPPSDFELLFFWSQHVFLVMAPLFAIDRNHRPLYRSWSWNYFGFLILCVYHWLILCPWGVYTGINVATMMSPPPALAAFKKWYRPVQGVACLVLHTISVGFHLLLCYIVERGRPRPYAEGKQL